MNRKRMIGFALLAAAFAMVAVLPYTVDTAKAIITGVVFCIAINRILSR